MPERRPDLYATVLRLLEAARADDQRLRCAIDQAIARLTAMLDAGRVSRTELQSIVEALRAAVALPSVDGAEHQPGHGGGAGSGDGVGAGADLVSVASPARRRACAW